MLARGGGRCRWRGPRPGRCGALSSSRPYRPASAPHSARYKAFSTVSNIITRFNFISSAHCKPRRCAPARGGRCASVSPPRSRAPYTCGTQSAEETLFPVPRRPYAPAGSRVHMHHLSISGHAVWRVRPRPSHAYGRPRGVSLSGKAAPHTARRQHRDTTTNATNKRPTATAADTFRKYGTTPISKLYDAATSDSACAMGSECSQ